MKLAVPVSAVTAVSPICPVCGRARLLSNDHLLPLEKLNAVRRGLFVQFAAIKIEGHRPATVAEQPIESVLRDRNLCGHSRCHCKACSDILQHRRHRDRFVQLFPNLGARHRT